ncbi:MAG: hypothetical protein Fur005_47830 [Roseiflexaceae bacterium]
MDLQFAQLLTIIGAACLMAFTERVRLQRAFTRLQRWWHAQAAMPAIPSAMRGMPEPPGTAALVTPHGLATRSWAFLLNDQPDRAPHVLLVGSSGAGKTTFTRALTPCARGRWWC